MLFDISILLVGLGVCLELLGMVVAMSACFIAIYQFLTARRITRMPIVVGIAMVVIGVILICLVMLLGDPRAVDA